MTHPDDLKLLAALSGDDPTSAAERLRAPGFPVERFRAFADRHQLGGFLHCRLDAQRQRDLLPDVLAQHFQRRFNEQRTRCDETIREAAALLDELPPGEVLFLKGPFVAKRFFGDVHARSHWDVDLLIRADALPRIDRKLRELDYARRSIRFLGDRWMTRFTHTYEYRKDLGRNDAPGQRHHLPLDLHWCLQSHQSFRIREEDLWRETLECTLDDRRFPVLGDEYTLVQTLLSIFVDLQLGVLALKSFVDLDNMLRIFPDPTNWGAFLARRRREGLEKITLNVLHLYCVLLDREERHPELTKLLSAHADVIRETNPEQLLERSRFAFRNRRWAIALHQAPVWQSILWALASLPFRVAGYESRDPAPIAMLRDRCAKRSLSEIER
jgi:hypothetical protein